MWGKLHSRLVAAAVLTANAWCCATCLAQPNWIGDKGTAWPSSWTNLGIDDPRDTGTPANPENDFVGNEFFPGGYWAQDSQYIYFRMRVDADAIGSGTFSDATFVLIDRVGYNDPSDYTIPDYAFTWDSKSGDNAKHGLEMQKYSTGGGLGNKWSSIRMDDVDNLGSSKGTMDINGNGRTTDGYVRTVSPEATGVANFGDTSFIDVAVSWNYLTSYSTTVLGPGQTWKVTFGSIHEATDHNPINYDIAGGASPSSLVSVGWSGGIQTQGTPEPATWLLTSLGATGFLAFRRWRKKKEPEETSECETP